MIVTKKERLDMKDIIQNIRSSILSPLGGIILGVAFALVVSAIVILVLEIFS